MENSSDKTEKMLAISEVSLPKGGGAYKGTETSFKIDAFRGETVYSIPIYT